MAKTNTSNVDYSQKVLEVKDLKKHFVVGTGKSKLTVPAVDGVTFDVYKREVFGLVGESGCGKTTTGRTIIKLYTPTDGSTDLEGITIGAGFQSDKLEVKRLKKERKDRIQSLNPYKKQVIDLKHKADEKIDLFQSDIEKLKRDKTAKIKEINEPLDAYKNKVYEHKTDYILASEKIKYEFSLKKAEIIESTKNPVETEYKHELKIAKNKFLHKEDGLKESAALKKEVIEQRLEVLNKNYEAELEALKTKYEPLIEEAEQHKVEKEVAKAEIKKLTEQKKKDLVALKDAFENKKATFTSPDQQSVKLAVKEAQTDFDSKIAAVKQDIKDVKDQLKADIDALVKPTIQDMNKEELDAKVAEIKEEIDSKIEFHQDKIRAIKETNKSRESLDQSRKMQMIFQDPISSLNPRMTVKEIIGEGLTILGGYSKEEIEEKVGEALELVGLSKDYMARYPHEFSGGQRQRIGVARALIMDPTFIIADEPISALDVSIRAQVINLLSELRDRLGLTILFIAHDLSVVRFFCDRIAVMYYGKIVELATSEELFKNPMHPYTRSLLSAIPQPDPDYEKGRTRINYNPAMHDYRTDKPSLQEISEGHMVYANEKEFKALKKQYNEKNKEAK